MRARRRRAAERRDPRRGAAARRSARGRERASGRTRGRRRPRAPSSGRCRRSSGFRNLPGLGVEGVVEGHAVRDRQRRDGIGLAGTAPSGPALVVADTVKPTSAEAVAELKRLGLTPVLLTGDNEPTARAVAAEVGIERVARRGAPGRQGGRGAPPAGGGRGRGDGRRRRQRRARARPGRPRPRDRHRHRRRDRGVPTSRSSRATCARPPTRSGSRAGRSRTIKGNLFWAFAYNVAAIPLAVAGLLNPIIAAAAMAVSSLFVVTNSLRLRRFSSSREGDRMTHGYVGPRRTRWSSACTGSRGRCAESSAWSRTSATASTSSRRSPRSTPRSRASPSRSSTRTSTTASPDAIASGDREAAAEKTQELLDAVERFARTR